jgi:hypothetical protein
LSASERYSALLDVVVTGRRALVFDAPACAQPRNRATAQPRNRATAQPRNRATAQPRNRATAQPRNRATAQPRNRATAQPIRILLSSLTFNEESSTTWRSNRIISSATSISITCGIGPGARRFGSSGSNTACSRHLARHNTSRLDEPNHPLSATNQQPAELLEPWNPGTRRRHVGTSERHDLEMAERHRRNQQSESSGHLRRCFRESTNAALQGISLSVAAKCKPSQFGGRGYGCCPVEQARILPMMGAGNILEHLYAPDRCGGDSDLAGVSGAGICAAAARRLRILRRFARRYGAPPLRERPRGDATTGRHRCLRPWHLQLQ